MTTQVRANQVPVGMSFLALYRPFRGKAYMAEYTVLHHFETKRGHQMVAVESIVQGQGSTPAETLVTVSDDVAACI